jgi:hypothetical protein
MALVWWQTRTHSDISVSKLKFHIPFTFVGIIRHKGLGSRTSVFRDVLYGGPSIARSILATTLDILNPRRMLFDHKITGDC